MLVTCCEFPITWNRALVYTTTTNMEDVDAPRLAALDIILAAVREEEKGFKEKEEYKPGIGWKEQKWLVVF